MHKKVSSCLPDMHTHTRIHWWFISTTRAQTKQIAKQTLVHYWIIKHSDISITVTPIPHRAVNTTGLLEITLAVLKHGFQLNPEARSTLFYLCFSSAMYRFFSLH